MCTTCGCAGGETRIDGLALQTHDHGSGSAHKPADGDAHKHAHGYAHPYVPVHGSTTGAGAARRVRIEQDILAKNNAYAAQNRRHFAQQRVFTLNLVSSPGSGKTTLLVKTIAMLKDQFIAVIEGDQQTSQDAERIRASGAPAVQINTGKACHLDAHMIGHALEHLPLQEGSLLMIENVGNLVCPAAFDLGEAHKVVILSVTEGEDKPLKYPDMFRAADVMLLNKIDLLPHLDFDVELAVGYARRINPEIRVLQVSATTGAGLADWLRFLREGVRQAAARSPDVAAHAPDFAALDIRTRQ